MGLEHRLSMNLGVIGLEMVYDAQALEGTT